MSVVYAFATNIDKWKVPHLGNTKSKNSKISTEFISFQNGVDSRNVSKKQSSNCLKFSLFSLNSTNFCFQLSIFTSQTKREYSSCFN